MNQANVNHNWQRRQSFTELQYRPVSAWLVDELQDDERDGFVGRIHLEVEAFQAALFEQGVQMRGKRIEQTKVLLCDSL